VTAGYEIVRYAPEFREGLVRLQTHLWSSDVTFNDAYFAWKHEENPLQSKPLAWLALHDGEVVGMRSVFATRWEAGQPPERFEALYTDDFAIAPDHRNRGLASRLMETAFSELARDGRELLINLSAGPITLLSSLVDGWKNVLLAKPLGYRSVRTALLVRLHRTLRRLPLLSGGPARSAARAAGVSEPFSRFDRAIARRAGWLTSTVRVEREPRAESMADLVARLPYDGRIRQVRDARYLGWRYRNPMHDYRFLYREGDGLEGYLVLLLARSGRLPGRLCVADWEGRDEAIRMELLDTALACGGFAQLIVWSVTVEEPTRPLLEERGFRPFDGPKTARGYPGLLVRSILPSRPLAGWAIGGRRVLDRDSWDLRMIYSMHG
jgi:GNAT superfamily N-acetyltransferase